MLILFLLSVPNNVSRNAHPCSYSGQTSRGGGLEAEAFAAAALDLHAEFVMEYGRRFELSGGTAPAGLAADSLELVTLAGALTPIKPITSDVDFEPGTS